MIVRNASQVLPIACLAALLAGPHAAIAGEEEAINLRGTEVFTWSVDEKLERFRRMDALFPAAVVRRASKPAPLPAGAPLAVFEVGGEQAAMLDDFLADEHVVGLLVLHDGRVRLEHYAHGFTATDRWTSFSVAKSITSTLIGAAIKDGYIDGLDADITRYIRELEGSAYDGVTVRQLLTMTSGVSFNEDYADSDSDIMRLYRDPPAPGIDATVSFVRQLPREAEPGTMWRYKTPETNLAGVLVMAATGRSLSRYLSETIWQPYGMEMDATWLIDHIGNEQGGCCLQAGLRDFARFGRFILDGAKIDGESILPKGWLEVATSKQADTGVPGGYGYQWWPVGDGTFQARGIFGQLIHLDPERALVVVIAAAWPGPREPARRMAQFGLLREIAAAIDAERGAR